MDSVSTVGLGKLGQCLAATLARRGFQTLGVDINQHVVASINRGEATVVEPELQEIISLHRHKLRATTDHSEAIAATDATFILVATPSDPEGNFSNKYLESALKSLATALRKNDKGYHLFVLNSTVMPGSIRERLIPIIEKFSGRRLNEGFGVCHCPELLALGSVMRDIVRPDFVIIGQSDERAGVAAEALYRRLTENNAPIFRTSLIDAEIAKVALNCYITLKISFANVLANLCERIPGSNVDAITQAIGSDRRISPYYLRGGLAYGGTCFPRDTIAFMALARKYGLDTDLISTVEAVNERQKRHLSEVTLEQVLAMDDRKLSVLGLSFKPGTPVIMESPAIHLIQTMLQHRVHITVYDPLAMEETRAVFGAKIRYADSIEQCLRQSATCVVTTQCEDFRKINSSQFGENPKKIIDCWRILDASDLGPAVEYIPLGRYSTGNGSASLSEGYESQLAG